MDGRIDARDRDAILAMAGVFAVDFDFCETVPIEPGYALHEPHREAAPVELAHVLRDEQGFIRLQHLLVFGPRVIKHWRQDWIFENRDLHEYERPLRWRHRALAADAARGTWTQRVYQIDDSPRYQCFGRWSHAHGLSTWESNWAARPKPRRELAHGRDDYDLLVSRNRHSLASFGWVHEQDSYKLALRAGGEQVLTRERGVSRYRRVDAALGAAGRQYWQRHAHRWAEVVAFWEARLVPGASLAIARELEESFPEALVAFVEGGEGPIDRAELTAFITRHLAS
jgi:hypothetical protein